jgi:hypothetical protein
MGPFLTEVSLDAKVAHRVSKGPRVCLKLVDHAPPCARLAHRSPGDDAHTVAIDIPDDCILGL